MFTTSNEYTDYAEWVLNILNKLVELWYEDTQLSLISLPIQMSICNSIIPVGSHLREVDLEWYRNQIQVSFHCFSRERRFRWLRVNLNIFDVFCNRFIREYIVEHWYYKYKPRFISKTMFINKLTEWAFKSQVDWWELMKFVVDNILFRDLKLNANPQN